MRVLVDTSVWSLALRRTRPATDAITAELAELIREGRVEMIGPVRQELLSGIKVAAQYARLRDHLRAFPDLALVPEDYEQAAALFNRCRERGIQGSNTDLLICAVAERLRLSVFTTDADFKHFRSALKLALHEPR